MTKTNMEQYYKPKRCSVCEYSLPSTYIRCCDANVCSETCAHKRLFVIQIKDKLNRDKIRKKLINKNIQTGIHYKPNHWLTYFLDTEARPLEVTDKVFERLLTLPLHTDLTISNVNKVCDHLIEAL